MPSAVVRHGRAWGARRLAEVSARLDPGLGADTARRGGGQVSVDDVGYAYRLLLGRAPDSEGLRFYEGRLARGELSLAQLAEELLGSGEFARSHPTLVGPYRSAVEEVEVDHGRMLVESGDWAVGGRIARDRDYEPDVSALVRQLLAPGGVLVDIGANIGWYSLLAASIVGPAGRVVAVEPNVRNLELLERSSALNGHRTIDFVGAAVSSAPGWLALETDASNGRVVPLGEVTPGSAPVRCTYAVPAVTLDAIALARPDQRIDVVKVDVEGVETQVFQGGAGLLAGPHRPAVVFEWYPEALRSTGGVDPVAPLDLLRRYGYRISVVEVGMEAAASRPMTNAGIEARRREAGRELLDLYAWSAGPADD